MEFVIIILLCAIVLIALILAAVLLGCRNSWKNRYDDRGFDPNRVHRNGTKYDDYGFDYYGYDVKGYNQNGYNRFGKNKLGQYDRFFDTQACELDGFCDVYVYPVGISHHADLRIMERLGVYDSQKRDKYVLDAYRYGKSKRQIKNSSAYLLEEIEQKHVNETVLIYKNYCYIFSHENKLITVYKNEKVPQ